MTTRIQKWGNSLGIRIPKPYADDVGLEPDSAIEIAVRDGVLVITPKRDGKHTLQELVSCITKENRHNETEWGEPIGREVW